MAEVTSALDSAALAQARGLLTSPVRAERTWPVLAAAALFAVSALAFAAAMVMAPPISSEHVARSAPD